MPDPRWVTMTDFETEAHDTAEQAIGTLLARGGWDAATLAEIGETYVIGLGDLVSLALRRADGARGTVVCGAGCRTCCFQTVHVTEIEAFLIAWHLAAHLPAAALAALQDKVARAGTRVRGLNPAQRLAARVPCPLLDLRTGLCTVYPLRPLACRAFHSERRSVCEAGLRKPGSGKPIPGYRLPHQVLFGLRAGLASAFQAHGRVSRDLELIAAIGVIWGGDHAGARWLAGEDVFAAAAVVTEDSHRGPAPSGGPS